MYRFVFLFIALIIFTSACQDKKQDNSGEFFYGSRFNGNYFLTLPLHNPDSCIMRIKSEVPPEWYGNAFEGVIYNVKEGAPNSIIFKYLDLYEQNFAHDTILVFTKAFRGKYLLRENRYDTAMSCLRQANALSEKIHSLPRLIEVKSYLGEFYTRQGNYSEAVKSLLEAYNICITLPNSRKDGSFFELTIDIGNAYRGANDYASAQVWHIQAWDFARMKKDVAGYKMKSAALVADNYLHLNQLDSAKVMIDTAFYYSNYYQHFYDEATRYYILAKILLAQAKCTDALLNFWKAKHRNLKLADAVRIHQFNEGLGNGYYCLGRLDSAIAFYKQALMTPDTAHQARIHGQLSKVYAQQKRYDLAFVEKEESQRLSDKIFTIEKDKAIGRLQAEKELERRERLIVETINQNKVTRLMMISGLLALSLGLIIGLFWIYRKRREWQLAKQEKELIEAREQLKSQALLVAEHNLLLKERALEESNKQLDLKDLLIQKLQMKLTVDEEEKTLQLKDEELQSLKILTTDDWRKFRNLFEQRFPAFISTLSTLFTKITSADTRLLMLIKIGFDTNEISNVLGISSGSVYTNRYRLRKKLNLGDDEDLESFVQKY